MTLKAEDSDGLHGFDFVDIVNTAPTIQMTFEPNNPDIVDTITCAAYPEDQDSDYAENALTVDFNFQSPVSNETYIPVLDLSNDLASLNLGSIGAQVGDKIQCTVTVTDEFGATAQDSSLIVVGDR